jgi:hypothetical protein
MIFPPYPIAVNPLCVACEAAEPFPTVRGAWSGADLNPTC